MDRVSVRFYPMNQKSDRNWIHPASGVVVCGAYAVSPYMGDLKNGDFSICSTIVMVVCGAYAIRPYTNDLKNGDFSICSTIVMVVCGAYAIRPYPAGRKFIRVSIRFYPMNEKSDRDWIHPASGVAVCGAYAIRPYPAGRKFIRVSIRFYPMNEKSDRDWIHPASGVAVCGAYALAPLHGRPKKWQFFYPPDHRRGRLWGVCCCALHGRPKKWRFFYLFGL